MRTLGLPDVKLAILSALLYFHTRFQSMGVLHGGLSEVRNQEA